ncbi:hypothetical protein ACI8AF_00880 [Blastococcus sp. SYSU D00669]
MPRSRHSRPGRPRHVHRFRRLRWDEAGSARLYACLWGIVPPGR